MIRFNLVTRDHQYVVSDAGVQEEFDPDLPIVVDPSVTFHKHFEIPKEVNRDQRKVMIEMFSRYLPTDISEYQFQFNTRPSGDNGNLDVLGLAIKNEDLQRFKELSNGSASVYFLESVLSNPEPNEVNFLELSLPSGTFFAVFDHDFLTFIRYQQNPSEGALNKTREFVRNKFKDINRTDQLPAFPENKVGEEDWVNKFSSWLVNSLPRNKQIRTRSTGAWAEWRTSAWTLMILAFMTLLSWGGYEYYRIYQYENWMKSGSQKLLNTKEQPYQTLKRKVQKLRKKFSKGSDELAKIYPRMALLDKLIHKNNIHPLQVRIRQKQAQIIFMTESLENADTFQNNLVNDGNVKRAEIISTQSQSGNKFEYKVTVNVMWSSEE